MRRDGASGRAARGPRRRHHDFWCRASPTLSHAATVDDGGRRVCEEFATEAPADCARNPVDCAQRVLGERATRPLLAAALRSTPSRSLIAALPSASNGRAARAPRRQPTAPHPPERRGMPGSARGREGPRALRALSYGMQRVAIPAKLIPGGDAHVAPAKSPVRAIVAGNVVEKLPSYGSPVEPNTPEATVVTVPAPKSMQDPVTVA